MKKISTLTIDKWCRPTIKYIFENENDLEEEGVRQIYLAFKPLLELCPTIKINIEGDGAYTIFPLEANIWCKVAYLSKRDDYIVTVFGRENDYGYSLWYIPGCSLLLAIDALKTYYKSKHHKQTRKSF